MDENKIKQKAIQKELAILEAKKEKLLFKEDFLKAYGKKKLNPFKEKITGKIPEGLEETLIKAFSGAFRTIFKKGMPFIEKTYQEDALKMEYQHKKLEVEQALQRKNLKMLRSKNTRHFKETGMITAEGIGLGAFGISLPDIPIFIGVLLRTCAVSANSFGIDSSRAEERYFMLQMIYTSVVSMENRREAYTLLCELSKNIDDGVVLDYDLENAIAKTSQQLAKTMLLSRFVMGIPLVGAAGGLYHSGIIIRLRQLANLVYEERMLKRCESASVYQHKEIEKE